MKTALFAFSLLCAFVAPCSAEELATQTLKGEGATAQVAPAGEPVAQVVPAAAASTAPSDLANSYQLGPGDEIIVTVFNEPDLKTQQKIGAQGEISLPLIGNMKASGKTSAQLASDLETKFRGGFLLSPSVNVTVMTYRPFYVVGEVSRPGAYPYLPDLTVAGAIATAGGFARDANRGDVYLRRVGETAETKVRSKDDIVLKPGDTLRIGRSAMSNLRELPLGLLGLF